MTNGFLGSSAILTSSLFGRGLGRGRFGVNRDLLLFLWFSFLLSLFPSFYSRFSLREPGSKRSVRNSWQLWGTRTEHRSYVNGPLLDMHVFTCALSKNELDKRNQIQISEKVHDLGQRIVLKVKMGCGVSLSYILPKEPQATGIQPVVGR